MSCSVKIPSPLRRHTNGEPVVRALGEHVEEILRDLRAQYPALGERLFDARGGVASQLNIFLNAQDIERLEGVRTNVREGDVITLLPARIL